MRPPVGCDVGCVIVRTRARCVADVVRRTRRRSAMPEAPQAQAHRTAGYLHLHGGSGTQCRRAVSDPVTLSIKFTRPDGLVANVLADPGKTVLLGRDLSCDVRLDGRKVSRRHLRIENRTD